MNDSVCNCTPILDPRLEAVVEETAIRLRLGLGDVIVRHGLTRSELTATQTRIGKLARRDLAPALDDFWAVTAQPRAELLLGDARTVIDRELDRLTSLASRPGERSPDFAELTSLGAVADTAEPIIVASEVERRLTAALPANGPLDDLGLWWLKRLRRAALAHALPALLREVPAAAATVVANREMQLLHRPPWCHGDRLLSAFELAHADVRRYGRHRITTASRRLPWPVPC